MQFASVVALLRVNVFCSRLIFISLNVASMGKQYRLHIHTVKSQWIYILWLFSSWNSSARPVHSVSKGAFHNTIFCFVQFIGKQCKHWSDATEWHLIRDYTDCQNPLCSDIRYEWVFLCICSVFVRVLSSLFSGHDLNIMECIQQILKTLIWWHGFTDWSDLHCSYLTICSNAVS